MTVLLFLERVRGIEPPCSAWEADILPLNYTRKRIVLYQTRLENASIFCLKDFQIML